MSPRISRREWLAAAPAVPAAVRKPRQWNEAVPLGRTNVRVTPLGMGCEEVRDSRIIARAVELGIGYFNCFRPVEGDGNIAAFGDAVRPYRSRITISAGTNARTREAFNDHLESHLRLMKTETIDLWYLSSRHKPEHLPAEVLEATRDAIRAGTIRAAAVTTHGFADILPYLTTITDVIGAVMVTCNFATWQGSQLPGLVKKAREAGLGVVAMKPMLGGLTFVPNERKAWAGRLTPEQRVEALAAAVRWVIANPHVDTAPVQMRSIAELDANVAAAKSGRGGDRELLSMTLKDIGPYYCRMCNQCESTCRRQLPVADLMRFLLYHDGYDDTERARAAYHLMPERIQKVRCQDCTTCTVICPNGVRVQDQITRAQGVLA